MGKGDKFALEYDKSLSLMKHCAREGDIEAIKEFRNQVNYVRALISYYPHILELNSLLVQLTFIMAEATDVSMRMERERARERREEETKVNKTSLPLAEIVLIDVEICDDHRRPRRRHLFKPWTWLR